MASYTFGEITLRPSDGSRLDGLLRELREEFPKLVFQRKVDHWYWRLLAVLPKVITFGKQRTFNSNFTTTIGMVIGWGENKWEQITKQTPGWEDSVWSCLMHERKHLRRFKQYGVLLCAARPGDRACAASDRHARPASRQVPREPDAARGVAPRARAVTAPDALRHEEFGERLTGNPPPGDARRPGPEGMGH